MEQFSVTVWDELCGWGLSMKVREPAYPLMSTTSRLTLIAMHLETLLYMLLQSDKVLPPPGARPDFNALSRKAKRTAVDNEWIKIPATTILVGMDDPMNNNGSVGYFGWDNEKPARKKTLPAFEAKARPLTNEDFARYLIGTKQNTLPASWTQHSTVKRNDVKVTNGSLGNLDHLVDQAEQFDAAFLDGKFVRTVYGPVALRHALAWPVFASFDELTGCAQFMNGRIPTADEVRSIYNHVDLAKKEEAEKVQSRRISAVNGHLSNDGVEESPPSASALNGSSSVSTHPTPNELFMDLDGCNVGLSNFHPTAVTHLGNKLCGRGEMGGVWEWTSSVLEEHEGFEAMDEYPGYTGTVAWESGTSAFTVANTSVSRLFRRETQHRPWWLLGDSSEDSRQKKLVSRFDPSA